MTCPDCAGTGWIPPEMTEEHPRQSACLRCAAQEAERLRGDRETQAHLKQIAGHLGDLVWCLRNWDWLRKEEAEKKRKDPSWR